MTTPTFRSLAIAQLRQYATDTGLPLQCKLNASNETLRNELLRIESEIIAQEQAIQHQLMDIECYKEFTAANPDKINLTQSQIERADTDFTVKQAAILTARVYTLVKLCVALFHQWDQRFTNHPRTQYVLALSRQSLYFVYDVLKWQWNAQLGSTSAHLRMV